MPARAAHLVVYATALALSLAPAAPGGEKPAALGVGMAGLELDGRLKGDESTVRVATSATKSVTLRAKPYAVRLEGGKRYRLTLRSKEFDCVLVVQDDKGKQLAWDDDLSQSPGDDGLLQLDEVMALKLNADLVVLSACETGKGRLHNGEGVRGLARAFLYAGSRGVVCSLWQVDDRATSELMVHLYRGLKDGRPAAEALRDARLALMRDGRPPLYWAPFVLIGE